MMPHYDGYAQYRTELTQEQHAKLQGAQEALAQLQANGELEAVPGGFRGPSGFIPDPVLKVYTDAAIAQAEAQFDAWPRMPEDEEAPIRFPGVDPVGKFSVIDMKFEQRLAAVRAALESRAPEVRDYARSLMDSAGSNQTLRDQTRAMFAAAEEHRTLTRASKLCPDPEGRRLLHERARSLEVSQAVEQMDKYLQGVEYAAGVRTGPVPQEIQAYFANDLQMPLNMEVIAKAPQVGQIPREIHVDFQNLEHKFLQRHFSDPRNWGKPTLDVEKADLVSLDEAAGAITPYARVTADRVIDPLFHGLEDASNHLMDRGDLIIVDGKTVRERIQEQFQASGRQGSFDDFYRDNSRRLTNELVSSALMAGKRVEAFVPDQYGRLPQEPVQITKTGYEPSPLKKVTLNAWQRHFSKYGFYKEKVAKAAEYKNAMEARERVRAIAAEGGERYRLSAAEARIGALSPSGRVVKDQFFSAWVEQNGPYPDTSPDGLTLGRMAGVSLAVCAMCQQGHRLEDIMDPGKLQAEKQAIGSQVLDKVLGQRDMKWVADTFITGGRAFVGEMDRLSASMDITDPQVIFSPQAAPLLAFGTIGHDCFQELDRANVKAAAIELGGKEGLEKARNELTDASQYFNSARQALTARRDFLSGRMGDEKSQLATMVSFEYARRLKSAAIQADPAASRSSLSDPRPQTMWSTLVNGQRNFQRMVDGIKADPAQRAAAVRGLVDGSFTAGMKLEMANDPNVIKMMESARFESPLKPAAPEKAPQKAQRAATPKQMGGPSR